MVFFVQLNLSAKDPGLNKEKPGSDILLEDVDISFKYQKGKFLIYDCLGSYWVCTSEMEYKRCHESRRNSLADRDENLPCASLKEFSSKKDCIKEQVYLTNNNMENRFCTHPIARESEVSF